MATGLQVVLLERVESLGNLGEIVTVRPGYARNYLLPQKKALRATKANLAYFEAQKAALTKINAEKKAEAEKLSKKIEGIKVPLIRMAAEGGQLFGSVNARDIAVAITEQSGVKVDRSQVVLNTAIKTIGLFPVSVSLHPELKSSVTVNVARSEDEAKVQAKTGKALIADAANAAPAPAAGDEKAAFLEEGALAQEGAEAAEAAADEAAAAEKKAKKASKKKPKAEDSAEAAE